MGGHMRWYLDTEFNEDGKTIELISIALVSEHGLEYYAHADGYDPAACNDWVKANVLPQLELVPRIPRHRIAAEVRQLLLKDGDKPEIWAYFADYDWVVFCQLFGRMVDLPKGMPFWCRDLKQLMADRGVSKEELPPQVGEHEAIFDARWVREAHRHMLNTKTESQLLREQLTALNAESCRQ